MQTSGKLRSLRAENSLNSRAGSVLPSSMKAHVSSSRKVLCLSLTCKSLICIENANLPLVRSYWHELISEVRCWLALRASVLRRAVSSAGTAQERRAKVSAGAVCWDFRCTEPIRWSSVSRRRLHAVPQPVSIPHKHTPKKVSCAVQVWRV